MGSRVSRRHASRRVGHAGCLGQWSDTGIFRSVVLYSCLLSVCALPEGCRCMLQCCVRTRKRVPWHNGSYVCALSRDKQPPQRLATSRATQSTRHLIWPAGRRPKRRCGSRGPDWLLQPKLQPQAERGAQSPFPVPPKCTAAVSPLHSSRCRLRIIIASINHIAPSTSIAIIPLPTCDCICHPRPPIDSTSAGPVTDPDRSGRSSSPDTQTRAASKHDPRTRPPPPAACGR